MNQDANELRREIEQVRGDLGDTIDAIGDKVAPRAAKARPRRSTTSSKARAGGGETAALTGSGRRSQVSKKASATTDAVREAGGSVQAKAGSNPLAAGLVAFGAGLAIAAIAAPTEREREAARRVREQIEPLKQEVVDAGRNLASDIQQTAQREVWSRLKSGRSGS